MEEIKRKRIRPQSAKAKGRCLQQWVCKKISELTGHSWGQDEPIESRPMGQPGTDIRMESHVRKAFPFSVECKFQESWSVHSWVEQAKVNQGKDTAWLLVCKRSRKDPVVIMDANTFFKILQKIGSGNIQI
jgi:hypothetical protein